MNEVLKKIKKIGVVPVVVLEDSKNAAPLAGALCRGGLPCAEVTFRTEAAADSIRAMAAEYPQMLIGAGTVLTTEQVDRAVAAGAAFIVSPGFDPAVVKYCLSKNIPVVPGTSNPSEVAQAIALGLDAVKFFPAEAAGGLKMIKAMAGPYNHMMFMPTGGVNAGNLNDYLSFDKILACGGSWMVKDELIEAGRFDEIERLTREAVMTMLGFTLKHLGVNCKTKEEARQAADRFSFLFGQKTRDNQISYFSGSLLECMNEGGRGANGHIAIGVNSVERAANFLESQGVRFDWSTARYNGDTPVFLYLEEEIGGFAIHLTLN